jgi:CheY-like chemotaxis protein
MRPTVLVVDDEEDVRAMVREILEPEGYTLLDTGDPEQALRLAKEQPIHLLIVDVVMPVMKGTELATRLQLISGSTRVLLMSGYPDSEAAVSGGRFLAKPFTPDVLAQKVWQVLA